MNSALKPFEYVHDELGFQAPEYCADDVAIWLRRNMEEGMSHFLKTVPPKAEPKIMKSWAEK
jgi:DNA polymerase I-like protein with 3'-5' exonuclease and polymerase domains